MYCVWLTTLSTSDATLPGGGRGVYSFMGSPLSVQGSPCFSLPVSGRGRKVVLLPALAPVLQDLSMEAVPDSGASIHNFWLT